jgi:nucleoid-associated protein YgaU
MYDDEKAARVRRTVRVGPDNDGVERAVGAARELRRAGLAGLPRRAHGPRPARPAVVAVAVRPAQGERPVCRQASPPSPPYRSRQRTLVRPPMPAVAGAAAPARRFLGGLAVAVLAAVVVVGLGLLAGAVGGARAGDAAAGPTVVTIHVQETVWDVARRVEPGAGGAELAAVAERIAAANSLTSASLRPGQTLLIPSG